MHVTRILVALFAGALVTPALSAQAPADGIDAHINTARTAAGLDYRATFVNLCFTGANPGLANPAVARRAEQRRRADAAPPVGAVPAAHPIAQRGTHRRTRSSITCTGSAPDSIRRGRCARAKG